MQNSAMFECDECHKKYANRGSLNRHIQNHRKSRKHTCPICQLDFYRNDLLKRHSRIHQHTDPHDASIQDRSRARTACRNCSKARVKCSGNNPCSQCLQNSLDCVFDSASGRVSTDRRVEGDALALMDSTYHDGGGMAGPDHSPFDSGSIGSPIQTRTSPEIFDFQSLFSPQTAAWPWLYEEMFLLPSQNPDWFDFGKPGTKDSGMQPDGAGGSFQVPAIHVAGVQPGTEYFPPDVSLWPVPASNEFRPSSVTVEAYDAENVLNTATLTLRHLQEQQRALVATIVKNATESSGLRGNNGTGNSARTNEMHDYFCSMSSQVQGAFDLEVQDGQNIFYLDHFVELYWEHFWILWPLFPNHTFSIANLDPVLYLVLGSIGAMYGGKKSIAYGALMHEELRELLSGSMIIHKTSEADALALAQARCLTQCAALYFGHKQAFSYAQHIGGILVAQARRMDIFSQPSELCPFEESNLSVSAWLKKWLLREGRRRTAYSIMRLEMYSCALLSSRPLLSSEEMEIQLPCSRYLWHTKFKSDTEFVTAIHQDLALKVSPCLLFSDMLRIILDENEPFPIIDPLSQELVLYAMQEYLWLANKDSIALKRLTKFDSDDLDDGLADSHPHEPTHGPTEPARPVSRIESHFANRSRSMQRIRDFRDTVTMSLRKWETFSANQPTRPAGDNRSNVLNCLLLYHLSFLRLHTPLEPLHSITYHSGNTQNDTLAEVHYWAKSRLGYIAVRHALEIFSILRDEAQQSPSSRARFNFLALIGLHHAAVTVWAYAGTHSTQSTQLAGRPQLTADGGDTIHVIRSHSSDLLDAFVKLFDHISPAWSIRSSFSAAARRLATIDFPQVNAGVG